MYTDLIHLALSAVPYYLYLGIIAGFIWVMFKENKRDPVFIIMVFIFWVFFWLPMLIALTKDSRKRK